MAFTRIGSLDSHGAPVLRQETIANTITSVVLDSVKLSSGFVALGTAGALVFGHITAHKSKLDVGLLSSGAAGAGIASYQGTYLSASDNQTVGFVQAETDISKMTLYSAELSQAIGTTTGSNLAGYHIDLTDEDTLDETSAVTGTAQYTIWGVDPANSARNVVNIYESQVFGV